MATLGPSREVRVSPLVESFTTYSSSGGMMQVLGRCAIKECHRCPDRLLASPCHISS